MGRYCELKTLQTFYFQIYIRWNYRLHIWEKAKAFANLAGSPRDIQRDIGGLVGGTLAAIRLFCTGQTLPR